MYEFRINKFIPGNIWLSFFCPSHTPKSLDSGYEFLYFTEENMDYKLQEDKLVVSYTVIVINKRLCCIDLSNLDNLL